MKINEAITELQKIAGKHRDYEAIMILYGSPSLNAKLTGIGTSEHCDNGSCKYEFFYDKSRWCQSCLVEYFDPQIEALQLEVEELQREVREAKATEDYLLEKISELELLNYL